MNDSPLGYKITSVAIMLDVPENVFVLRGFGIVEVVGGVTESVDLQLMQGLSAVVGEEPIKDDAALKAALGVKDENGFVFLLCRIQGSCDERIASSGVRGTKVEASF